MTPSQPPAPSQLADGETVAPKDFTYLKAGDRIVFDDGVSWGRSVTVRTVVKVTATQIVLGNDIRFRITDGGQIGRGDRWHFPKLLHVTTALLESIEHASLVRQLSAHKWEKNTLGVLRDIQVMLRRAAAAPPSGGRG